MTRALIAAALVLSLDFVAVPIPHALAQQPAPMPWLDPEFKNDKLMFDYREPLHPKYRNFDADDPRDRDEYKKLETHFNRVNDIYQRLKNVNFLERYSQFISPVKLPLTLRLFTEQCGPAAGESNAFYSPSQRSITLCYEYVRDFEDGAPKQTTPEGITRADAIVGAVVSTMLHETGHAVYNLLQIPVLGREEDAGDQLAAFVMLQFGREIARTTIKGAAWKWHSRDFARPLLSDEHSTAPQRLATYLCMAYGKDREGFQDLVDAGWLPKTRVPNCPREYEQARLAFNTTLLLHINQEMMAKVLAAPWLRPDDVK
jgi:hypothetical protein